MGMAGRSIDDRAVFLDTSVLVRFVQQAAKADCFDLFKSRSCDKWASPAVEEEYSRKRENREYIVKKFQEQVGQVDGDFSDLDIPHKDRFSPSDEDYAKNLLSQLKEGDEMEAMRELSRRRKLFKKGSKYLFGDRVGQLRIYKPDLDANLIGNLRMAVDNRDDRQIIAGAVEWADEHDYETLLSEDYRDFMNCETDINEAISLTRGFDCCLSIFAPVTFLEHT